MSESIKRPGLYLIATPLGNLSERCERAHYLLEEIDLLACEDTRITGRLLKYLDVKPQLIPYHDHNENKQAKTLLEHLGQKKAIGLVSDAGMPVISDPGYRIVKACHEQNYPVIPVGSGTALIAALSASGLPPHPFYFAGFLPPKSAGRCRFFEELTHAKYTTICYESRYRILKAIDNLIHTLGDDRAISVARELTKRHESILTGKASEVYQRLAKGSTKGEFVIVIAPSSSSDTPAPRIDQPNRNLDP